MQVMSSIYRSNLSRKAKAIFLSSLSYFLLMDVAQSSESKALTIKSQTATFNLNKQFTEFNKGIEIVRGAVSIHSRNLIKKNISQGGSNKTFEEMLLSGNPVKVNIADSKNHRHTFIQAFHVRYIPEKGYLEIQQDAKLEIKENNKLHTQITAHRIEIKIQNNSIQSIRAQGESVQRQVHYQLMPENGESIHSLADHLQLQYQDQKAHLYKARITQGDNKIQAGEIIVDGNTGNFQATSDEEFKPSISIDLNSIQDQNGTNNQKKIDKALKKIKKNASQKEGASK